MTVLYFGDSPEELLPHVLGRPGRAADAVFFPESFRLIFAGKDPPNPVEDQLELLVERVSFALDLDELPRFEFLLDGLDVLKHFGANFA